MQFILPAEFANTFITPHCSGMSPSISGMSPSIVDRPIALFLDNLDRYRAGQPLRNVVSPDLGY